MKKSTKITSEERDRIALLRAQGKGVRSIARAICRSPSSISDELARNRWEDGYIAIHADTLAKERKTDAKQKRHPLKNKWLYAQVHSELRRGRSPEQIAGRLKRDYPDTPSRNIHHETIYRFIYAPQEKNKKLWEYLVRGQKRRRKKNGRSAKRVRIPWRISIHERPAAIGERAQFGHWEGDTVEGRGHRDGIHTEVERLSRFLAGRKVPAITSEHAIVVQKNIFTCLPVMARQSTTLDNGKENHLHYQLRELTMETYFADPYSSWQRGTNENTNGILRRYLPKGTSFADLTPEELNDIIYDINQRPRKCLGYATPQEVFNEEIRKCSDSE